MKTLFALTLSAILLLSLASEISYSQTKGQIHFGLGSAVVNYSTLNTGVSATLISNVSGGNSSNSTVSSFSFLTGYFVIDKLRLDGGLSVRAYNGFESGVFFNLGARYFYYHDKKVNLDGGISANFGLTAGTERTVNYNFESYPYSYERRKPINLSITPIEFQYWPFEGGALTTDFTYTEIFLNGGSSNKQHSYGINIGLLIRLN